MYRELVMAMINAERNRQDEKWGRTTDGWDASHPVKLTVLVEEVGEVGRAILECDIQNLQEELVQTAAVCVAWLESLEKGNWR